MGLFHIIGNSNGIPYDMKNLRYGGRFYGFAYVINTGCWIGDGCICCFYLQRTGDERKSFEKRDHCWFMVWRISGTDANNRIFLGTQFKDQITSIDHWIAFVLLGLIGINMVKEALSNDEEQADDSIAVKEMFMLAVATSIDALAVGITFAFLNVHIVSAASMIGVCTFLISFAGVKIGNIFGTKYKSKAELAGGIILILLGFKILFEHLHIL